MEASEVSTQEEEDLEHRVHSLPRRSFLLFLGPLSLPPLLSCPHRVSSAGCSIRINRSTPEQRAWPQV